MYKPDHPVHHFGSTTLQGRLMMDYTITQLHRARRLARAEIDASEATQRACRQNDKRYLPSSRPTPLGQAYGSSALHRTIMVRALGELFYIIKTKVSRLQNSPPTVSNSSSATVRVSLYLFGRLRGFLFLRGRNAIDASILAFLTRAVLLPPLRFLFGTTHFHCTGCCKLDASTLSGGSRRRKKY